MISTGTNQHVNSLLKENVPASYRPALRLACTLSNSPSAAVLTISANNETPTEIAQWGPAFSAHIGNFPFSELMRSSSATDFRTEDGHTICGVVIAQPAQHQRASTTCLLVFAPSGTELNSDINAILEDIAALTRDPVGNPMAVMPNRLQSMEAIQSHIDRTKGLTKRASFGLIRFNLDHLSFINERYGWDTADLMLEEIIRRIEKLLPQESFFGSMGGGNFAVLTPPGHTLVTTRSLMTSILRISDTPISLASTSFPFSLSVGWSMFPEDGKSVEELLTAAKAALAEAQRAGGGHERRASSETTRLHILSSSLEQDLALAAEQDALFLKWMPIVDTASQRVVAHEALLRWNRPNHGEVSPELFIRCAEEAGMVEVLDTWSLRHACKAAAKWESPYRVCVNISPVWLASERLSKLIAEILQETGLSPDRLQIEMSESRFFGPEDITFRELARVRALGVRLALDDFGSGHSSLERLRFYPLDQIKLDRGFIKGLGENDRANEVMSAVLALARALNITTCAKGVETEYQMAFLDAYGCEEVQGYLLGSPVRDQTQPTSQPI
ncbi:diguanylate cyclase [Gluconobacter thailandicus]|nr:diguanylate cyclase [Gluconobacter thailandicus]